MTHLALSLLGPMQVCLDDAPVTTFEYNKVRALLAYLAVEADRAHRREHLIGLLWPDLPERTARQNLSQALLNLREALGDRLADPPFLLLTRETIQFNPASPHSLDVAAFTALLDANDRHRHRHPEGCTPCARRLAQATGLYRGDFLAEFFLTDSAPFEEWAAIQRETLRQRALVALDHLAAYYELRGDYEQATRYSQRRLELDPWHEPTYRRLMRVLTLSGQRGSALAQYARCRQILDDEFGVAPEPETTALYERVRAADVSLPPTWQPAPPPSNLPAPPTALVGREHERTAVSELLLRDEVRLVTLIGAPGIGKTRLGLAAAEALRYDFADGVFFVPLAAIRDPQLLVAAIAQTLDVRESGGQPPLERLKEYLRDKQRLLLLDNFEQIVAAAPLLAELLAGCSSLKLLVTSRVPVHLRGEQEVVVPPLATPDLQQLPPAETLAQYAAVELFIQRVRDVQPDFAVTPMNAAAVAAICARLDGLPLAIELAAPRIKLFSPQAILARLDQRFQLLVGGARDLPTRQQTLRSAIAWSYDLLAAGEQVLFTRLSVFAGGAALEAAEAICNARADLSVNVLDGLALLVDKNMLRREAGKESEPRFTMLETIQAFAREQLARRGELAALQRQHTLYYLALVEAAEPHLRGAAQLAWLERLETEYTNIRTALQWCLGDAGDRTLGLRLVGALGQFWSMHSYSAEGQHWAERALAHSDQASPALHARALHAASMCAYGLCEFQAGVHWAAEAVDLWRGLDDPWHTAFTLSVLGANLHQGDPQRAVELLEEGLRFARTAGDPWLEARVLVYLALALQRLDAPRSIAAGEESLRLARAIGDRWICCMALNHLGFMGVSDRQGVWRDALELAREIGDRRLIAGMLVNLCAIEYIEQRNYPVAQALAEESLKVAREIGERRIIAIALNRLGDLQRIQGADVPALRHYEESLALSRALGDTGDSAWALHNLGHIALHQNASTQAAAYFTESLHVFRTLGDEKGMAHCLAGLAGVAACMGQSERAGRLFGMFEALFQIEWLDPADCAEYERNLAAAQARLDQQAFVMAWAAGKQMPLEQMISIVGAFN